MGLDPSSKTLELVKKRRNSRTRPTDRHFHNAKTLLSSISCRGLWLVRSLAGAVHWCLPLKQTRGLKKVENDIRHRTLTESPFSLN